MPPESSPNPVSILLAVSASKELIASLPRPSVLISAEPSNWNDFGYKFRVRTYLLGSHQMTAVDQSLMIDNHKDTLKALTELGAKNAPITVSALGNRFCSLLQNASSYPDVVRIFGYDEAQRILEELHDAGLLERTIGSPSHLLLGTEAFHLGLLRDPTAYDAYRRGAARLKSFKSDRVSDVTAHFTVVASLPPSWRDATVSIDLEPDEFLRERVAVLVGPNGTGKTTLLLALARTILAGAPRAHDPDFAVVDSMPAVNGVIAFSTSPSDRYRTLAQSAVGPHFEHFQLVEPSAAEFDPLTQALVDLLRDQRDPLSPGSDGPSRRNLLEELLSPLALWDHIHLPVIEARASEVRTRWTAEGHYMGLAAFRGGEKKTLVATMATDISKRPVLISAFGRRNLSSGELAMFRFAVQIVSAIEPGCLLLLDEPETHLHPQFISQLMEMLDKLLKATGSVAIVATHSPFVVREAPRRRVRVLRVEDGTTIALQPRLQTFGASIDSIADAVFGDAERDHLHEKLLDRWLGQLGKRPDMDWIIRNHGAELNPETMSYLAEKLRTDEA